MKFSIKHIISIFLLLLIFSSCSILKTKENTGTEQEKDKQKFVYLFSEANKNRLLGNSKKAIELYLSAIDINPVSSASNYYLATIFLSEKNYNAALTFASKAVELDSENIWYKLIKGDIFAIQSKTKEAYSIYKSLQNSNPKNEILYNRIIDVLIGNINSYKGKKKDKQNTSEIKGDYQNLIDIYSEKQKHFGYDSQISSNLYKLYMDIRNFNKAEETLNLIIKKDPDEPKYQALLAEFYFAQNEKDKAETVYKNLIQKYPDDSSVKLSYAIFCKVTGKSKAYFNLVKGLLSSDIELNTKINLLISGRYPNFPKKQYEELLHELYKNHSNDLAANTLLAEFYIDEDKEKTITYLKKAVEISKSDFNLIMTYFEILYDAKEFETLYSESKIYLDQFPNRPKLFLYHGLSAYKISKYDEAVFTLDLGKDLVIENNKLLVQFHYYLAESFHKQKKHLESDEQFEKTLKINPKFYLALNNYSYYLSERNEQKEKALQLAEVCINYQKENPVFSNTYAKALFRNKQYSKALSFSENAVKLIPNNAKFVENQGDIYFGIGNKEKAKELWMKSKEIGNSSKELLDKINKL